VSENFYHSNNKETGEGKAVLLWDMLKVSLYWINMF